MKSQLQFVLHQPRTTDQSNIALIGHFILSKSKLFDLTCVCTIYTSRASIISGHHQHTIAHPSPNSLDHPHDKIENTQSKIQIKRNLTASAGTTYTIQAERINLLKHKILVYLQHQK